MTLQWWSHARVHRGSWELLYLCTEFPNFANTRYRPRSDHPVDPGLVLTTILSCSHDPSRVSGFYAIKDYGVSHHFVIALEWHIWSGNGAAQKVTRHRTILAATHKFRSNTFTHFLMTHNHARKHSFQQHTNSNLSTKRRNCTEEIFPTNHISRTQHEIPPD
jgi:hypothetical protein